MPTLVEQLKICLSDIVVLKFKAHGYHWNVEGDDFQQFHTLFGEIYADFEDSIDPFAENIRKLQGLAPYKLSRFTELTELKETSVSSDGVDMAKDLLADNEHFIGCLMDTFDVATKARQQGVANFLAERIDMHQKWSWQLRAISKEETEED